MEEVVDFPVLQAPDILGQAESSVVFVVQLLVVVVAGYFGYLLIPGLVADVANGRSCMMTGLL